MTSDVLVNYPYQSSVSGNLFPLVPLKLYFDSRIFTITALVDSGASVSVFRKDVAEHLGIKIESGKETYLGGVGGRIKGYIHKLDMEVAGKRFTCPVVFSYEYLTSLNLLGRQVAFEKFTIIFEEKNRRLKFE